jgi:hypothetical protein
MLGPMARAGHVIAVCFKKPSKFPPPLAPRLKVFPEGIVNHHSAYFTILLYFVHFYEFFSFDDIPYRVVACD